ncbi:MAG: SurA N-terminal domain-containing protein [Muribaculaceae bacterium]|nr:SurA N-terminal domain-containing protein [Muribaculaceae bacterium]
MLEYLRNASEKPIAKILIAILAFSFVGWGVAEWIFGGAVSDNALVRVGDAKITAQQFSNEKSRQLSEMPRDAQRELYADPVAMAQFTDKILEKLSTQQMTENRAHDLGFVVSDKRIASEIREFPEFQDNGKFSAYLFDTVLANSGLSEADFAEYLRSQILRSMVLGAMSAPLKVPNFATTAAYNARHAQRAIEYTTVKFADFNVTEPTDDQLRSFYAQNPQVVPESRNVSYVLVPAKMDQPDSYDAAFTIAQKVEDDIIGGESLANAAAHHNAKYVSFNDLTATSAPKDDVLNAAMISRLFHIDEGTESELIETKQGFVIARVDGVIPEHNAEFDSVKSKLASGWKNAEQKKQAYIRANEILVDVNGGADMTGLKSATVSRASGAPVAVLNAAFNGVLGTNSIVEDTDAFYVLHVGTETMPTVDTAKMSGMQTELQNMSSTYVTDDYNAFLKRQYPVTVNEKVFNRFFAK